MNINRVKEQLGEAVSSLYKAVGDCESFPYNRNAYFDYVNKHHLSSDGEAYDEGWDASIYEQVKLILKELED